MAQLNITENIARKKKGHKQNKLSPAIDMTPMVDLGFLLICFFVFTTTMSKPVVTDLFLPKGEASTLIGESTALTVFLGKNDKLFYYDGNWSDAVKEKRIITTNYSVNDGLGNIIRLKQKLLSDKRGIVGRNNLVLIIKATKEASYKNLIDALDEILINDVRHYAVVDPESAEVNYLNL